MILPSEDSMGGRGGHYHRPSSSPCGSRAEPLTRHRPASTPVSSRKSHGGDAAASFVAPQPNDVQERLSNRAIFLQPPSIQRDIRVRPQTARHAYSLPDRRVESGCQVPSRFFHKHRRHVDASIEERSPWINKKENGQSDRVTSRILSGATDGQKFEGANQVRPRLLTRGQHNDSSHLGTIDDISEQRVPKSTSSFPRRFRASRWITLSMIVICFTCFPTLTNGFRMHHDVESAANVLRGVHNINLLRHQLHDEHMVAPAEAPPFDWGPLFFLSVAFLIWFLLAAGGLDFGEQLAVPTLPQAAAAPVLPQVEAPVLPQAEAPILLQALNSRMAILVAVSLAFSIAVVYLARRFL